MPSPNLLNLLVLFFILGTVPSTFASFCGKSGVPYSFEVLSNGAPVLGCAQPSCVLTPGEEDQDFQEDSQFFTNADGQSDGFFRDGDRTLKRFRHPQAPKLIANCTGQFNELSCPRKNQWVGGIEYIDHPRQPLILQCCTFDGLRFSQEVGATTIGPGEAITGGEVVRAGRQISFDVIANVKKVVSKTEGPAGRVQYEVTVRRMNCLPDPPEPAVELDGDVPAEVAKVLGNAKNKELTPDKPTGKKAANKGQPKGRKGPQPANGGKAKQQAATTDQRQDENQLPEITGGEGDRGGQQPQQQRPRGLAPGRNSEAAIQPAGGGTRGRPRQPPPQRRPTQPRPQPQQQQFVPAQQQVQAAQQQPEQLQEFQPQQPQQFVPQQPPPQQFVPIQQPQIQQQQQPQPDQSFQQQNQFGGQQQPQFQQQPDQSFQQQTQFGQDMSFQQNNQFGGQQQQPQQQQQFNMESATPHPLFGMMSFPTLPPHTFPTLPPHTFPTLPPHSFPTLPPHTFPTLPPHSFPTLPPHTFPTFPPAPFLGHTAPPAPASLGEPSGGSGASAFAAPIHTAGASGPIPLSSFGSFPSEPQGGQQQPQPQMVRKAKRQSGFFGAMRGAQQPLQQAPQGMGGMGLGMMVTPAPMPPMMGMGPRMPTPPPVSGTILAAMGGERRPIMHPILGMIGYSNAPQQPGMLPGMGKKR